MSDRRSANCTGALIGIVAGTRRRFIDAFWRNITFCARISNAHLHVYFPALQLLLLAASHTLQSKAVYFKPFPSVHERAYRSAHVPGVRIP